MPKVEILVPADATTSFDSTESVLTNGATWWNNYRARLTNLSDSALAVLKRSSERIATKAMPVAADGTLNVEAWGKIRVRKGLVVGSVQSGKTASMLGVCAYLLDRKADIIVILAGTRVSLWMQTIERLLEKLDGSTSKTSWKRRAQRVLIPEPEDVLLESARLSAREYLPGRIPAVTKALSTGKPIIVVVPKEDDHLIALGRFFQNVLSESVLAARDRPVSMIVLDDEADDASVLDSADQRRVTPQHIQRLWADRKSGDSTRHERLFATYVAYTATPQANFLQSTHNPLSPRDFAVALQVPLDHGTGTTSTYVEHLGLPSFYCGGELFYKRFRGVPGQFCVAKPAPKQHPGESSVDFQSRFDEVRHKILGEALRSYFVSGALRLIFDVRRLSSVVPVQAMQLPELRERLPSPHTMLFHPSALRDDHFEGAAQIVKWSLDFLNQAPAVSNNELLLSVDGLIARLEAEEPLWKAWLDEYTKTAGLLNLMPGARFESLSAETWGLVKEILIHEVFPFTKLRVLNSDDRADERPRFEPRSTETPDSVLPPADIYTIFVAGNVLSRGLTVEGLCTSVFLRSSAEPAADTQMQMQRWFGYRGRHLAFCRIFLFADQLALFQMYHENDEALKSELLRRSEDAGTEDGALVLQGDNFKATSKVDSRRAPLNPGATPAVRLIENELRDVARANLRIVSNLVAKGTWIPVEQPAGTVRGIVRAVPLTMLEVADLLDQFRYSQHEPNIHEELYARWSLLETLLGSPQGLFRAPVLVGRGSFVDPSGCPYSIAAYLRLWSAALSVRTAPGLYPTDAPHLPWSMINLDEYRKTAPMFYVAIRFGNEGPVDDHTLAAAGVQAVKRTLRDPSGPTIKALWGTRGVGGTYFGDQLMDYHIHGSQPVPRLHVEPIWRPRGHPGLLLFYISRTALGDQPLYGLALPHGGPDHIAALRPATLL